MTNKEIQELLQESHPDIHWHVAAEMDGDLCPCVIFGTLAISPGNIKYATTEIWNPENITPEIIKDHFGVMLTETIRSML